jgi:chaperone modulatory protein CbpM
MRAKRTEYLISLDEFCAVHDIEISFISSLQETGLIEIKTIKETGFIDSRQLYQIEKILRFYYELGINLEGVEAITHLLQRMTSLQDEIISLRNRLRLYETNDIISR